MDPGVGCVLLSFDHRSGFVVSTVVLCLQIVVQYARPQESLPLTGLDYTCMYIINKYCTKIQSIIRVQKMLQFYMIASVDGIEFMRTCMPDKREGSFTALFHIRKVQEEGQNARTTCQQVLLPNYGR